MVPLKGWFCQTDIIKMAVPRSICNMNYPSFNNRFSHNAELVLSKHWHVILWLSNSITMGNPCYSN
jgi:hypothetical protein